VQEANQRAVDLSESFSKETEKKLQEKMDAIQENKKAKIQALLDRLSLHVCIVYIVQHCVLTSQLCSLSPGYWRWLGSVLQQVMLWVCVTGHIFIN